MNQQDIATITNDQNLNEMPNEETVAAIQELNSNGGHRFTGSTEQLLSELAESSE